MYTEQELVDSFMLILGCSSNLFNSFNKEYFCVSRLTTFLKKNTISYLPFPDCFSFFCHLKRMASNYARKEFSSTLRFCTEYCWISSGFYGETSVLVLIWSDADKQREYLVKLCPRDLCPWFSTLAWGVSQPAEAPPSLAPPKDY